MKFILSIRPEAEEDIKDAYSYYQQCQTGLGNDIWSVRVSGNWRVTYRFVGRDVEIVNYEDYH